MGSFASDLKSEREKRKISLSQIAADTRISLRHLESLEEGRYGDLPGGMYNRAFLKAYCESLNLDDREVMQRYEAEFPLSEKPSKSKASVPKQAQSINSSPVIVWSIMLLILASGLFLSRKWIADVFAPYSSRTPEAGLPLKQLRLASLPADSKTAAAAIPPETAPSPPPDIPTTAPPAPSQPPLTSHEASDRADVVRKGKELSPSIPNTASLLRMELVITEQCWVSIERDGNRTVRRVMEAGEVQTLTAAENFFLVVGNAGGVHMKINDKPAKPLGKRGAVVKLLINMKNLPDLIDQTAG